MGQGAWSNPECDSPIGVAAVVEVADGQRRLLRAIDIAGLPRSTPRSGMRPPPGFEIDIRGGPEGLISNRPSAFQG
ncbi:MAG: hypothetical protein EBR82_26915 [Caulobacteraceae bacterium]|nr:hypothetical protein [Caulobacteraceae bacterium]